MGPESTHQIDPRVSEELELAVTCLRRAMKHAGGEEQTIEREEEQDSNIVYTIQQITGQLERMLMTSEVLNGKMKCTTCGHTSVGLSTDCNDSATSTTTTVSHRSSEEPAIRRKTSSTNEDDEDVECSSIGSRSIRSVSSSVNQDDDDQHNQTIVPEIQEKTPEEEEHDLVMKTILSTTSTSQSTVPPPYKRAKKEIKEEEKPLENEALDMLLQSALFNNMSPEDLMKGMLMDQSSAGSPPVDLPPALEMPASDENEEKDSNQLLNNFFQMIFQQNQSNGESDGTDSTGSSQPSPPADPNGFDMSNGLDMSNSNGLDLSMIENLLAESMNQSDASTSEAAKAAAAAAARKRKNTPIKVPKSENGAGYVCPMDGCNKIFKEKGSVHRHFVTHIGMRFNCDKCKASYTQKHALMLHQKIHANPDAYQCRGCGTNYTTQNGLRLHRQRNPACMEQNTSASMVDFNSSLSDVLSLTKTATPNKQMVAAP